MNARQYCSRLSIVCATFICLSAVASSTGPQLSYSSARPVKASQQQESAPRLLCGTETLTHSASQVVTPANSISCNSAGLHADNSYFRTFDLSTFGLGDNFTFCEVTFGIETATGQGGIQPVSVRLYNTIDLLNLNAGTLIASEDFMIADQAQSIFVALIAGQTTTGELTVEIFTPSGLAAGNSFFLGSNAAGQTSPSYILAAGCGIPVPTDFADIGFPNVHMVMNVVGFPDCNNNNIPDAEDIANQTSDDCNYNSIPDECETAPDGDPSVAVEQDECVDAMLVCPGFDYVGNNLTATNTDGIFFCGLFYGIQDVYYRYRPAWDGLTFIRVEGPPIYWLYSVYDDCPSNGGVEITCNEQDHFNLTFNAEAGHTYYIRIASWGQNPLGAFEMNIVGPECALSANDLNDNQIPDECECPADVNGDLVVDMLDFIAAVMNFGQCFMFPCNSDVDGNGVVDNTDLSIILNSQGPCPFVPVRGNIGVRAKQKK